MSLAGAGPKLGRVRATVGGVGRESARPLRSLGLVRGRGQSSTSPGPSRQRKRRGGRL